MPHRSCLGVPLHPWLLLGLLTWLAWWPGPASAHLMPNSAVNLDFRSRSVEAEILIPSGELSYALGAPVNLRENALSERSGRAVRAYLLSRIGATAPDGRRWTETVTSIQASNGDVILKLVLSPPSGSSPRRFMLDYQAVIDTVPNHFVLVSARSDFRLGVLASDPELLGALQSPVFKLRVDREEGSGWRGFTSSAHLGMQHIAEGRDHLLFLITLMLPAPLAAAGRRWGRYAGLHKTARSLVGIVTSFTIGHSATLALAALLGWSLPARPVEILIALSVLLSALHALRPIFARKEPLVAGLFGLVHGMAFATVIGNFNLEPGQKVFSIFGFNLGIELVQLLVVACVVPWLVLLASTSLYRTFRMTVASLAAFGACGWIAERAGIENTVARATDAILAEGPWLLIPVVLASLMASAAGKRVLKGGSDYASGRKRTWPVRFLSPFKFR